MRQDHLVCVDIHRHIVVNNYLFGVAVIIEYQLVDSEIVYWLLLSSENLLNQVWFLLYHG